MIILSGSHISSKEETCDVDMQKEKVEVSESEVVSRPVVKVREKDIMEKTMQSSLMIPI